MIDSEKIVSYLANKGKIVLKEDIDDMILSQNRDEIISSQKKRFRYEIWDRKSAINDCSSEEILKSKGYKINQAYIVYVDDKLTYFQDHVPFVEGYTAMTKKNVEKYAQDFISKKIGEYVDNIIVNHIIQNILSNK